MSFNLEQTMYAADMAALRSALRSVFADSEADVDGIASLVVSASLDGAVLNIEGEYRDAAGNVVGGFGL